MGVVLDDVEHQHGDFQNALKALLGNAALGGEIAVIGHVAVEQLLVQER